MKYDPLIITLNKITLNVGTDEKMEISNKINGLLKKNHSISIILETKEKLKNTNQEIKNKINNLLLPYKPNNLKSTPSISKSKGKFQ